MGETGVTFERHRFNTSFTWQDRTGPFRRLTDGQAARFDRDGYLIVEDLVDAEMLTDVTAAIDALEAETEAFLRTQPGERMMIAEADALTFTVHIAGKVPVLRALVTSPPLLDLCHDLIGPDVNLYWDQAVYKKPGKPRRFPWHQDNGYTFIEPQQYLTVWLALTDATEENGCPRVAPGLHKFGTLAHEYVDPLGFECFSDPPEERVAEVRAGGGVVFSSLMPHLTGPNLTSDVRKAYIVQYAPAGARTRSADGSTTPCDDASRQFPVLRDGAYV